MTTVQCPSCGAAATNLKNCEFCGSLFVRYIDHKLDIEIIKDNSKINNEIFPGLEDFLEDTVLRQKEFVSKYGEYISGEFVATTIGKTADDYAILIGNVGTNTDFSGKRWIQNGLGVFLQFSSDDEFDGKSGLFYLEKFKKIEEFKLFSDVSQNQSCQCFWIDYGYDIKGAAYISTKIAREVFGITESKYNIDIWDSSSPENHKKPGCFIATATMGSYDHPEVIELRNFRDNWILEKKWGEGFVAWYYHYGSIAAKSIEKSFVLKKICYLLIVKPLVYLSRIVKK